MPTVAAAPTLGAVDVSAEPGQRADQASPWIVDALLGTAVALAIAIIISAEQGGERQPDAVAYVFAAGFGALMLSRRVTPRAVLVVTVLAMFVYYALGYPPIGVAAPVVAALFAAADAGLVRAPVAAGGVVVAVSLYFQVRDGEPLTFVFGYESVSNAAFIAAAIALGHTLRTRRISRAQQSEIARLTTSHVERDAALRMQAERERISRDLHDTVGHTMSIIALHASVAAEALGRDDAAAGEAVERIRAASTRSMGDLRTMVRLLRSATASADSLSVLSLAAVPTLVEPARAVGVDVTIDVTVAPADVSPPIDAAAYRVVQESITNIVRHAGATRAAVRAHVRDGTLSVEIADDGRGAATGRATGDGLSGMRERVRLLGGTLTAGSRGTSGFTVEARLPARLDP